MAVLTNTCGACGHTHQVESAGRLSFRCRSCGAETRLEAFPAIAQNDARPDAATAALDDDAVCFFHPHSQAALACTQCGVFLCPVCDVPIGNEHRCPRCVAVAERKDELPGQSAGKVRYDRIAFLLVTLPALCFWPLVFTAPLGFGLALFWLWRPNSYVRRSSTYAVVTLFLATVELAGGAALIVLLSAGGP